MERVQAVLAGAIACSVVLTPTLWFLLKWRKPDEKKKPSLPPTVQVNTNQNQQSDLTNTGQHATLVAGPECANRHVKVDKRLDRLEDKLSDVWEVSIRLDERMNLNSPITKGRK